MTTTPIDQLTELSADEVVTHSYVKHVPLPSGGTLALVTLDNGKDYKRPSTLGPRTMRELSDVLDTLRAAASAGSIQPSRSPARSTASPPAPTCPRRRRCPRARSHTSSVRSVTPRCASSPTSVCRRSPS